MLLYYLRKDTYGYTNRRTDGFPTIRSLFIGEMKKLNHPVVCHSQPNTEQKSNHLYFIFCINFTISKIDVPNSGPGTV